METNHHIDASANGGSERPESADKVEFTVIIPAYNPGKNLEHCLEALARSTYEHFDVIVVDDGSTESIKPLVDRFGYRYLLIDGPKGPARARNKGVEQATTNYVVFIDADVCVHPDAVELMARNFAEDKDLVAVIGTYDDSPADPGFLSQYRNIFHHYIHCQSAGQVATFWSGCGAMRRDVFLKYGGFDERRYRSPAIEDIELGTWITADGRQIMLDRKVQCKHLKRWSLANMIKTDIFQRGIPWIDLMLRSGKVVKNLNVTGSQRLSVALVFTACLLVLLSVWWPWMLLGAAAAAALVTFINIKLYRYLKSRRGLWFAVWSLPLHWIYFGCCGISVIAGTAGFFISGRKAPNGCKYSSEPDGTTVTRTLRRGK